MGTKRPAKSRTWLEVAIRNGGFRIGMRAMLWASCWVVVREALGYDPSVDEVAEWWKESRRTAFREQEAFRTAFPKFSTPAPMFESEENRQALRELTHRMKDLETAVKGSPKKLDTFAFKLGMLRATP